MQKIIGAFRKTSHFIFSFLSLYAVNLYFFKDSINYKNSVVNLFLFFILAHFFKAVSAIKNRHFTRVALCTALIFSLVIVLGDATSQRNDLTLIYENPFTSLIMFGGLLSLFYYTLKQFYFSLDSIHIFAKYGVEKIDWILSDNKKSFFISWLIIFLAWLPSYLAYYPGTFAYDIGTQVRQIVYGSFDNFHPLLHTLFFKVCMMLGDLFDGRNATKIAIYSVSQMLILSAMFAYVVTYLSRIRVHVLLRVIALMYFALNPVNAVFSFIPTKEIFFTVMFVLLTLKLANIARSREASFSSYRGVIWLFVVVLLFCMLRNNGMHAVILLIPLLFIIIKKHYLKILFIFFGPVLFYQFIIKGIIFPVYNVAGGDIKEAFALPIQQMAVVVVNHEPKLSDRDKRDMADFLYYEGIREHFNPRYADPVKDNFRTGYYKKNKDQFVSLWYRLFKSYPLDYMHEFLALNVGYWYPDIMHPDPYSHRAYIETWMWDVSEFRFSRRSKLPWLIDVYESMIGDVVFQKVPVLSVVFSIGAPFWFLTVCISVCASKRRWRLALVFLLGFMYWLTFMGGPVANLRYIYPVIASYPIYLAAIVQPHLFSARTRLDGECDKG